MEFDVALDKQHLERLGQTAPLTGIIELIWNALDADASEVRVTFGRNDLDGIEDVRVVDDGHGMRPEEVEEAFGSLGGSWKRDKRRSRIRDRPLHGRDGRGRFRAAGIGDRMQWRTVAAVNDEADRRLLTTIELRGSDLAHVVVSEPEQTDQPTGTTVVIDGLVRPPTGLTGDGPISRLTATFALALQNFNAHLSYDGEEIDPSKVQANRADFELEAEGDNALLTVVEWARRIDRGLYLCDAQGTPLVEQQAGIHAPGFEFTAYLQWTGFEANDELRRVECRDCGVRVEAVPWARPDARHTRDFENLVAFCAQQMAKSQVQALLRIAWDTVGRIIERVVADHLDERRLAGLVSVGCDELSYRRGQRYLTNVADHATGRIVWSRPGRNAQALRAFFDELGERKDSIKAISIDMSGGYEKAIRAALPDAQIAFDPFHVVALTGRAVDDVRREEWNAKGKSRTPEGKWIKNVRWALRKAPEQLTDRQRVALAQVQQTNARL